jgi:hypothetical protein
MVYYKTGENVYNLQKLGRGKKKTTLIILKLVDITESGINIKMNSYELPVFKDEFSY